MKKTVYLPLNGTKGKILHLTDTHLFAEDNECLLGIDTNTSFYAVIDEINQQVCDFDLVVATGDFVQDGSKEAYRRFAKKIKQLSIPCFWLPGNHDVYDNMKEVFEQQGLPETKVVLLGENWLIVMLNSQVPGKAYGLLSDDELSFLETTLMAYPNRDIALFLHHHPVMSNCQWLDQHCLKNSKEFGELVKQHKNIKSIAWGHIHQKTDKVWHHCRVFSTPSTCVQFKSLSNNFAVSNEPPSWRFIELNSNGEVTTTTHCLSDNLFEPDTTMNGY
ncbi:3',5'-cyclic-AMP phosphodiesterase [Orbus mooreae]|uniref:3',5'-cyclic-AMP phosphodiesterase n=1 Tax=Orbus mooreae TaxID=3074107 RepID=UPI00370DAF6E